MRSHRRTLPPFRLVAPPLGGVLFLLLCAGCARQAPTEPTLAGAFSRSASLAAGAAPAGTFFPPAIGNRWHAVGDDRVRIEPLGGGAAVEEFTIHNDIARVLVGDETLFGRPYLVEEETTVQTGDAIGPEPWMVISWLRYRQDASGLYEADVAGNVPPVLEASAPSIREDRTGAGATERPRDLPDGLKARLPEEQRSAYEAAWGNLQARAAVARSLLKSSSASGIGHGPPGGILDGEITRLRYPLHPGREWVIRPDPFFSSAVEGVEDLALPAGRFPAYRIRIDSEFFSPEESAHIWFGRSGQLAIRFHLVSIATDAQGNDLGTIVDDYDEVLHDLSLVKP